MKRTIKNKMPPSVRRWGWNVRYIGSNVEIVNTTGTVFTADRRDISPYVYFPLGYDNNPYPVTADDFERL
jgi:hypothetical protein